MDEKELNSYLKICDEENTDVEPLQLAAEEYLSNAGIRKSSKRLYDLAVKMLTTHWHDNRGVQSDKPITELPYGLRVVILQLQLSEGADDQGDTEGASS